jgi:hypothetical protein
VDLYIHSPIRLHGVVLNYLSTGTILPLGRHLVFSRPEPRYFTDQCFPKLLTLELFLAKLRSRNRDASRTQTERSCPVKCLLHFSIQISLETNVVNISEGKKPLDNLGISGILILNRNINWCGGCGVDSVGPGHHSEAALVNMTLNAEFVEQLLVLQKGCSPFHSLRSYYSCTVELRYQTRQDSSAIEVTSYGLESRGLIHS